MVYWPLGPLAAAELGCRQARLGSQRAQLIRSPPRLSAARGPKGHYIIYYIMCIFICVCIQTCSNSIHIYICVYIYVYGGVPQRGAVAARARSALLHNACNGHIATFYIPPVADLRFSNKPCLRVAKLKKLVAKTHMK